jgi:hypothetical protein
MSVFSDYFTFNYKQLPFGVSIDSINYEYGFRLTDFDLLIHMKFL